MSPIKLYNTTGKTISELKPVNPPTVGLYTCGMTVYDYAHIGHGKKYVGDDILRRTLTRFGYAVRHVQNVTDVGHLVSDQDEGEDKMEKGAVKAGQTVWETADFFTEDFYASMDLLNVIRPDVICRATEHIPEQIELVKILLERGYAYDTPEAVYYDVSKFPNYGDLTGQTLGEKKTAARQEVETGTYKKQPADFVLWFKCVGRYENHVMRWESPWGVGFPGWHIECSAMSMKYLGDTVDIHTGGVDHISIHHPNEIAQSEAATGKPFVRHWIHYEFLLIDDNKMGKSLGNTYRVQDVIDKGFDPLALRYFFLTAHYRSQQNFTWQALQGAQNSLSELLTKTAQYKTQNNNESPTDETPAGKVLKEKFNQTLGNDLNTPQALAIVWETVKSTELSDREKYGLLIDFDSVLGLKLDRGQTEQNIDINQLPPGIQVLIQRRETARNNKAFTESDEIRAELIKQGYAIEDGAEGPKIKKIN